MFSAIGNTHGDNGVFVWDAGMVLKQVAVVAIRYKLLILIVWLLAMLVWSYMPPAATLSG
jgi:hypothetical protein